MQRSSRLLIVVCLTVMTSGVLSEFAAAQITVTQTFDELPFQPIDNLSFKGVTFDYKLDGVDSDDAKYGSFGPGITEHVDDPSVVGNSRGTLTFDFDIATPIVEFGAALSDTGPLSPGFTVDLFDASLLPLATIPVDTAVAATPTGFSDGLFQYNGAAVSRMVVDFADAPGSFALDNLIYVVPEPSCCAMILALLLPVASLLRRWPRS